ncbi:MAG: isoprenylcysteine carboxylmethyltransferase family protein [Planctomycetes bacterium]|nr:isoprenylcysteine carboxylmethyltransferase family protein [Planctomycetota bacterium]
MCILGNIVRLWAAGHVRKSKELERHGPYAFVRHPQYLGNSLIAIGLSLAAGLPLAILIWVALFLGFYVPAIRREDAKLHRRFDEDWEKWAARTPAVVPLHGAPDNPGVHAAEWSLLQALKNGEPAWLITIGGSLWLLWTIWTGGVDSTLAFLANI